MKTRVLLTGLVALAVLGGIFGLWYHRATQARAAAMQAAMMRPPTAVSTTIAEEQPWQTTLSAFGTLESHAGITVRTEAEGQVLKVAFASGDRVAASDLLVELDAAIEQAQLEGLEASAALAEIQVKRARELWNSRTNSKAELDLAEAKFKAAQAEVARLRAVLAKKRVTAPFAGQLGITQVDPGQFLDKGAPIVLLESVDPIYVDFGLPEKELGRITPGLKVSVQVDAFPDVVFKGKIEAVNPRISENTRNVRVRAILPNPEGKLRAGMSARVEVHLPDTRNLIVLPTTAVVYNPYGNAVYVVTEEQTERGPALIARQQFVEVGATRGSQVSILEGLRPGDQVVTSGQIKLRNGIPVQINNTVVPSSDPAPNPPES